MAKPAPSDNQIVECIATEMRLVREIPNHCQHAESIALLAKFQRDLPHLYAMAEITVRRDGPKWTPYER